MTVIRVATVNFEHGGWDVDGGRAKLDRTLDAVRKMGVHAVLGQEHTGLPHGDLADPRWGLPLRERERMVEEVAAWQHDAALKHLEYIARRLEMEAVCGAA